MNEDPINSFQLESFVRDSLKDLGRMASWGDDLIASSGGQAKVSIVTIEATRIFGADLAEALFRALDPHVRVKVSCQSGQWLKAGELVLEAWGASRELLRAESLAVAWLSEMSGLAAQARRYVDVLQGTPCQLIVSRGLRHASRFLEKAALIAGGARTHRFGLSESVLIRRSHADFVGSVSRAVELLRESLSPTIKLEVEVEDLDTAHQAVDAGADLLLLRGSFSLSQVSLLSRTIRGRASLEWGEPIELSSVLRMAEAGVDFIGCEAIVQQSPWVPFGFKISREDSAT